MRAAALALCALLTGCATVCPPTPPEPVWALSLVPEEVSFETKVLYLMAENDQREAWGLELLYTIEQCRK